MRIRLPLLILAAFAVISCKSESKKSNPAPQTPTDIPKPSGENSTVKDESLKTPANFKVAFVGDQGMSDGSKAVLNMIKKEATDLLIIPGDFDYENDPNAWDKMLEETVGDMPILASIGNHDILKWGGYADKLKARLAKMPKAKCEGEIGVSHKCIYEGLLIAISGIGTKGNDHEKFLEDSLKSTDAAFKICVWHKNQRLLQAGDKTDETGYGVYESCREEGAIIVTAHEHSYERTHLLSDFKEQTVVNTESNLIIQPGHSFAFVTGLGGKNIRPEVIDDSWWRKILNKIQGKESEPKNGPWWAKIYTETQAAKYGALFCVFNVDNKDRKAHCYFKNIADEIVDDFTVESKVGLVAAGAATKSDVKTE